MNTLFWVLIVLAALMVICRYGPLIEDYYADARAAKRVVEAAECFCLQAVRDENTAFLDDLAILHPMPQRPAPPAAALDEPWQLPAPVTDPARLVERSEIHDR